MIQDSLGDRMKAFYENSSKMLLPGRMPVVIRVDGKSFHSYTKKCKRPFDENLSNAMIETAKKLCDEIQGAQIAYTQSDEISILVHGYKKFNSKPWFDNQVQKICSVAASIAGSEFTARSRYIFSNSGGPQYIKPAYFDARAFIVPEADVCNYFIWRQQDATRNSIQMLARSMYSDKQCFRKDRSELQEMCLQKGMNWNNLEVRWKRGTCIRKVEYDFNGTTRKKWEPDFETPIFTGDRNYIEKYLVLEE